MSTQAIWIVQELRTQSMSKQGRSGHDGTNVDIRSRNFRLTSSALSAFWSMFDSVNGRLISPAKTVEDVTLFRDERALLSKQARISTLNRKTGTLAWLSAYILANLGQS